jgi:hypothetical protein
VAGQRDEQVAARLAAGVLAGQDGQEGMGEQGQDGPPVPGGPGADLVLVQGGQLLAAGEPDPATITSWANGTGPAAWAR